MITHSTNNIDVTFVPVYRDNYAYILKSNCGAVGVVDPGEAAPLVNALEKMDLNPDFIFVTHHHWDHANGVAELKAHFPLSKVVASHIEKNKIDCVDIALRDNDTIDFGQEKIRGIITPGHTNGSICYYFQKSSSVFTGDTLFSLSCGGLFEGTAAQMFRSFEKLKALPGETLVFCGHEYTRACAGFCLRMQPKNKDLIKRIEEVKDLRAKNMPSLPSTIDKEKKTNVFMMAKTAKEFADLGRKK